MRIWNWIAITRVLAVTDKYARNGASVDYALSGFTGEPLSIARLMNYAMHFHGIRIPTADEQLLVAAWQYGQELPVEPGKRVPGALLEKWDGTLALALDQVRTIESAGTYPVIVAEPEADRYRASWECPGLIYLGGGN